MKALDLCESVPEWRFDCVTALASHILGAPFAAISLVDQNRQWFKSKIGLEMSETPRSEAFCDHTIRQNDVMVVEDADADVRFKDLQLVTGPMRFKYYAGAPIQVHGENVGALCVLDRRSHRVSEDDKSALMLLSQLVASMLQTDLQIKVLQSELERLTDLVEESSTQLAA